MPLERLQKVIAGAGVASRRASEAMIAAGRVTVDGRPARLGDQVDPLTARIEIDGQPIGGPAAPVHLALHKPAGVTSTVGDRHAERTVLQLLPTAIVGEVRLYPVGRLDRDSEGLLLLTNDGEWAERVLHPRFGVEREYAVGLAAWLTAEQRAALDAGIDLEEGRASFAHRVRPASAAETASLVALLAPPTAVGLAWYRVVLRQGWKRQVRRMFGAVGAPIARLVRVRIGPVKLDGLAAGRHRRLRGPEIQGLGAGRIEPRRSAAPGETRPAAAGARGPRSKRTRPAAAGGEPPKGTTRPAAAGGGPPPTGTTPRATTPRATTPRDSTPDARAGRGPSRRSRSGGPPPREPRR